MNNLLNLGMIFIGGLCIGASAKQGIWTVVAIGGALLIMGSYYV